MSSAPRAWFQFVFVAWMAAAFCLGGCDRAREWTEQQGFFKKLTAKETLDHGHRVAAAPGAKDEGDAPKGARKGARKHAEGDAPSNDDDLVFVDPPFKVKGDLRGLHLVWFDGDGVHTAKRRSDIPESARGRVRVESLSVESPDRLGPDRVYVADVRNPLANGSYPVHIERRATFDAWADHAQGRAEEARSFRFAGGDAPAKRTAATTAFGDPVIMYRTSWCGVCKKADKYFRERGVEVVEKDVERDPAAAREMSAKVSAHGLKPGAVPVIDIDGEVMQGFSRPRLDAILTRRLKSI